MSLISVQERFNTLSNLQMETYEYGIPPIYADSEVLDFDSLQNQTAEPGVALSGAREARASRSPRDFSSPRPRKCLPILRSTPRI